MEKTLTIDGRQIRFKHTGGTLMRYRNQFNSDFLKDFTEFASTSQENYGGFSYACIERIIWALAKTADDSIPDPQTWLYSFEDIDIIDVWAQLGELVGEAMKPLVKSIKKAQAAGKLQNR